jgi:3-oxoacyl-[acyl-carrier-protein] synthase II
VRRAVVTGVGVVSPFGVGARTFWGALREGRCAVGPIRSFDASTFATRVAAEVPVERPDRAWIARHVGDDDALGQAEARGLLRDRKTPFALLAAVEAWRAAACGEPERDAALVIALGLEQALLEDFAPLLRDGAVDWAGEPALPLPRVRFRSPVDLPAQLVRARLGLRGPVIVNTSACAAGTLAVAQAAALIERGRADVVVCGGADSMVNPLGIGGMSRLGAPSPRNEPDACRPFDARRDGLAIGEGAALFVLEEEAHAARRGARPLARVAGWASTQDAYRVTAPRPDGAAARAAMVRAVERAGIARETVGYINAHGTGTPLNDPSEARAIRDAFGAHAEALPVSSIKGAVGHLMAAAGAVEIAASLLAFEGDFLPGTVNHQRPDPECPLAIVGAAGRAARVDWLVSNSFGFGGQNASIVLGRVS